jgi:hypothetical protein
VLYVSSGILNSGTHEKGFLWNYPLSEVAL